MELSLALLTFLPGKSTGRRPMLADCFADSRPASAHTRPSSSLTAKTQRVSGEKLGVSTIRESLRSGHTDPVGAQRLGCLPWKASACVALHFRGGPAKAVTVHDAQHHDVLQSF